MTDGKSITLEKKAFTENKAASQETDPRVHKITQTIHHLEENILSNIDQKMRASEEKIGRMIAENEQPALEGAQNTPHHLESKQHQTAFLDYVRSGNDMALRQMEVKGYRSDATGAEGGFLVTPQLQNTIQHGLAAHSHMRSLAHIVMTQSGTVEFLVDPDSYGAGWVSETGTPSETNTGLLRKVTIRAHDLYAMPKATQRLLDDASFNMEEWMSMRITETFSESESEAFITGDGNNKPHGILSKPQAHYESAGWGTIGTVATGDDDGFGANNPQDVLIDTIYALAAPYRSQASWLMNSKTASFLRKLKDADGRYLWTDGVGTQNVSMLMGYPVYINENMPDIGTGTTPIAFGNFKRAYAIVDSGGTRILRDPYSAKPHIYFYVVKRVGGDVIDYSALRLVKCTS